MGQVCNQPESKLVQIGLVKLQTKPNLFFGKTEQTKTDSIFKLNFNLQNSLHVPLRPQIHIEW